MAFWQKLKQGWAPSNNQSRLLYEEVTIECKTHEEAIDKEKQQPWKACKNGADFIKLLSIITLKRSYTFIIHFHFQLILLN